MSVGHAGGKPDDIVGSQLMAAVFIDKSWSTSQDENEFVLGLMPMTRCRSCARRKGHVIHTELGEPNRLRQPALGPPLKAISLTMSEREVAQVPAERLHRQRIDWPVDFQSFTNASRPALVSGWSASL